MLASAAKRALQAGRWAPAAGLQRHAACAPAFRWASTDASGSSSSSSNNNNNAKNNNSSNNNNNNNPRRQQRNNRGRVDRLPRLPNTAAPVAEPYSSFVADFDWDAFLDKLDSAAPVWSETLSKLSAKDVEDVEAGKSVSLDANDTKEVKVDTSVPLARTVNIDKHGRAYGTGRRKTSTACVWIKPGQGDITINRRELVYYFGDADVRFEAIEPLIVTDTIGQFDVNVVVSGGGFSGQAGAIRMGLARALQNYNPAHRSILKPLKMLRRDPRMVERKKGGQPKARKKFQWVKR